jgi:hypothetical protein
MAIATATITINGYPKGKDNTQRNEIVFGTIAISTGGTYPPGGFPLSWANLELQAIPAGSVNPSSTGNIAPFDMTIKSASNPPSGDVYLWDNVVGNLHIFEAANSSSGNSGPLQEVGGAIDNRIVTDSITFVAYFTRN